MISPPDRTEVRYSETIETLLRIINSLGGDSASLVGWGSKTPTIEELSREIFDMSNELYERGRTETMYKVAVNPGTSIDFLVELSKHPSAEIAEAAKKNLKSRDVLSDLLDT